MTDFTVLSHSMCHTARPEDLSCREVKYDSVKQNMPVDKQEEVMLFFLHSAFLSIASMQEDF